MKKISLIERKALFIYKKYCFIEKRKWQNYTSISIAIPLFNSGKVSFFTLEWFKLQAYISSSMNTLTYKVNDGLKRYRQELIKIQSWRAINTTTDVLHSLNYTNKKPDHSDSYRNWSGSSRSFKIEQTSLIEWFAIYQCASHCS